MDPNLAAACDAGNIEELDADYLTDTAKMLADLLP